jgi:hypothetical protein
MKISTLRRAAAGALLLAAAFTLTSCSSDPTQAQSISEQKADLAKVVKYVPASSRGKVSVTAQNQGRKDGQLFPCDSTHTQFLTGRLVRLEGIKDPQKFISTSVKKDFERDGYATSWYTGSKPRTLVADKDDFQIRVLSGDVKGEKASDGSAQKAVIFTSFGKCFSNSTKSGK